MRKRILLNAALLAAVAVLVLLLFFAPDESPETSAITALEPSEIYHIQIDYPQAPDASSLELSREGDQWFIKKPVSARAATSAVAPLLALAARVPVHRYAANEIEPAQLGLDKPQQRITFNNTTIDLGGVDSLDKNRYAQVSAQVFLIPNIAEAAFDADYSDLLADELLPKGSIITQLELPQITLIPTAQGGWNIEPPTKDRGADAAQYTIDAWGRVSALWIKPADTQKPGTGSVHINTKNHGRFSFEIIERSPQLILRNPALGVDYSVGGSQTGALLDLQHPALQAGESNANSQPQLKTESNIKLTPDADDNPNAKSPLNSDPGAPL